MRPRDSQFQASWPSPAQDALLIYMPASMDDMVKLAYGHDNLKRNVSVMTKFDPEWKLPEGFFTPEPKPAMTSAKPAHIAAVIGKSYSVVKI